jgi:regulatory protein
VKISKIEIQKKNSDRCSIFIDGEFKFGLTKELVIKHDLYEGAEITEQEINKILHSSEKLKIMNRAFKILHYRQRSVQELRSRLLSIGYDVPLVDDVIDALVIDNTLDDERFARAFVNDHTSLKPKGNRFIINELIKKGIAKETIVRLLDKRDEEQLIRQYIEKKARNLDMHDRKDRQKLLRRLLNRGFTSSLVYEIISKEKAKIEL